MSFIKGFSGIQTAEAKAKGVISMTFDWDKAAQIIKIFKAVTDFTAEAGLQNYWYYTAGAIFENGNAISGEYIYLQSSWATPTLVLNFGEESIEIECWSVENERFKSDTTWDEISLNILNS